MRNRPTFALFDVLPIMTALCLQPAFAQHSCENLATLTLTNAIVTSATSVSAGPYGPSSVPNHPSASVELPAYCRVDGIAKPTSDSEIKFEIWLPVSGWNGKFEQAGNGGFAGALPLAAMVKPLLRGYATGGTDDGHVGVADLSWAIGHPEKVIDYGYRAVHETSIELKAIIRGYYGKDPAESYFVGCSDGGREALMEAQRYPGDFNGILAGSPGPIATHILLRMEWTAHALLDDPASYIPAAKFAALQQAAINACDTLDGVKDGVIQDPRLCHFDLAVIQCGADNGTDCLTAPQVEAARKIFSPLKNTRTGAEISPAYEPGTKFTAVDQSAASVSHVDAFVADLVYENPNWDYHTRDFDTDVKVADEKLGSILNPNDPNLSAFAARGGKLIQYHGWSDASIPPEFSVNYFESVQKTMGNTQNFYRLFMAPGVAHCGGGIGAIAFANAPTAEQDDPAHDMFLALDKWVVQGTAPDQIIATGFVDGKPANGVAITRPLCPYPQEAHYKGSGDTNNAENFTCQVPAKKGAR